MTGPLKFAMAHHLLMEEAVVKFKEAFLAARNKTNDNFKVVIKALIKDISPAHAIQNQKCYIHHFTIRPIACVHVVI